MLVSWTSFEDKSLMLSFICCVEYFHDNFAVIDDLKFAQFWPAILGRIL